MLPLADNLLHFQGQRPAAPARHGRQPPRLPRADKPARPLHRLALVRPRRNRPKPCPTRPPPTARLARPLQWVPDHERPAPRPTPPSAPTFTKPGIAAGETSRALCRHHRPQPAVCCSMAARRLQAGPEGLNVLKLGPATLQTATNSSGTSPRPGGARRRRLTAKTAPAGANCITTPPPLAAQNLQQPRPAHRSGYSAPGPLPSHHHLARPTAGCRETRREGGSVSIEQFPALP